LVGDANLDWKDYYGTGPINYVPAHIFDSEIGETPGDNWFVTVDGNDVLPDMFIGRLPVRTLDETARAVQKILNYATASSPGNWRNQVLFIADDDRAEFAALNRSLRNLLPSGTASWLLEAQTYPPGNLTQDVVGYVNAGVLLLHYTGHSAVDHWGTWSGGYILSNANVAGLTNASQLPFATSADCISGFFALPGQAQSLAETLLSRQGGGAVAVWSPTGLSYTAGHQVLFPALYQSLFAGTPVSVGAATTAAKLAAYAQSEVWGDLVESYTLFGDPALRLNYHPTSAPLYLPMIFR